VLVAHNYNPSYSGDRDHPGLRPTPKIVHKTLARKKPIQKRAGRVAQVVERLPSKGEALISNHSTTKKKKKKKTKIDNV
jgi:hypothetical protein